VAATVPSSQELREEGQAMEQRIESVHPGNPYLQERASIEKRRRDNLAMDTADAAQLVERARVEQLQKFGSQSLSLR
jgi:hypothetical protein